MNQRELANKIGIPEVNLSYYLNDHRKIGASTAKKIAKYLKKRNWRKFIHMPGASLRRELENCKN